MLRSNNLASLFSDEEKQTTEAQRTQRERRENFTHHLDWLYIVNLIKAKHENNELLPKIVTVQLLDERATF